MKCRDRAVELIQEPWEGRFVTPLAQEWTEDLLAKEKTPMRKRTPSAGSAYESAGSSASKRHSPDTESGRTNKGKIHKIFIYVLLLHQCNTQQNN
jgi:hypothetical protein